MTAEPLDGEDAKLVVLARSAMARAEAGSGAAVRDVDGRTYAGAPVNLSALQLTALQTAVAAAVSSGAAGLEAAVLWPARPTTPASPPSAKYRRRPLFSSPTAQATSCND